MADKPQSSPAFDSSRQYLGTVYAKALIGVTEAAGKTQAVLAEFDSLIADVLDKMPAFDATLSSLRVAHAEKEQLLDKAFKGKMSVELLNFLKVVSRHGRLDCLRVIHRAAHQLEDELRGRLEVEVRTAEPVDQETLAQIRARLHERFQREIVIHTKVDSRLIGGLVVRVGDTVFDGSVANQLQRFADVAVSHTVDQVRRSLERFVTVS